MTQFIRTTFGVVAYFFVISSIIKVVILQVSPTVTGTELSSNYYKVWRYEQTTVRSYVSGTTNSEKNGDETSRVTFDVKIRPTHNNALKNRYDLLVKFNNISVLSFLNNNRSNNNHQYGAKDDYDESFGIKLSVDGDCKVIYTKVNDDKIDLKRTLALLLFPDSHHQINQLKEQSTKGLSDCFQDTPLGSCKIFVRTMIQQDNTIMINKHTNADYCDEEHPVFESLSTPARPSISPDSSLDVKYLIDHHTTDNKLSRVEMLFKINYPSESEGVENRYVLTYKGYDFNGNEDDDSNENDLMISHDCALQ